MMSESNSSAPVQNDAVATSEAGWKAFWFLPHVVLVYLIARFVTPWLAGWTLGTLLPIFGLGLHLNRFEFLFSHLLSLSSVPAFCTGLANARFRHSAAQFVWIIPTLVLIYKLATFSSTDSVLFGDPLSRFHYYFSGNFLIPDYHTWKEFWLIAGSLDMTRGVDQLLFTGPFYAGIAYSLGVWIGIRTELTRKVIEKFKEWEKSRFENRVENV